MILANVRQRVVCVALALFSASWSAPAVAQEAATPSPGTGTLYVGSFAKGISIIDEATSTIVGTIPYKSGTPRRTVVSRDRTRFYTMEADMEIIEILDIPTRRTLDSFTLSQGNTKVRIRSFDPDPTKRFLMMVTRAATKLIDRWEIGPSELVQFDLAAKKVVRTIPWPNGEERENANILFSPDGTLMYLFSEQDILIYETDGFTHVDTWELSKPQEEWRARLQAGSTDTINDEPGFYTGLFTMQDPVQNRRVMGIGRVNLAAKSIEFSALGPATGVGFTMAPDRKVAYGLSSEIGKYEFWKFDLESKRVVERHAFAGRPRMSLRTSSNGKVLYVYNAGETIDLYDAATFAYMKTIHLPGDHTTELFVFPGPPSATTSSR
jgi:DNA-binding beta-propeller fold protein YncE